METMAKLWLVDLASSPLPLLLLCSCDSANGWFPCFWYLINLLCSLQFSVSMCLLRDRRRRWYMKFVLCLPLFSRFFLWILLQFLLFSVSCVFCLFFFVCEFSGKGGRWCPLSYLFPSLWPSLVSQRMALSASVSFRRNRGTNFALSWFCFFFLFFRPALFSPPVPPVFLFLPSPPALSHLLWLYSHRMPPLPGNKLTVIAGVMTMHPFLFGRVKKKKNNSLWNDVVRLLMAICVLVLEVLKFL